MKYFFVMLLYLLSFNVMGSVFDVEALNSRLDEIAIEKPVVLGVGEHILLDSQTLDEGFDVAEKLAKSDAVKQFGEYFEVVRMTDTSSMEVKEVVTSVNASILKYDVVKRESKIIDGEIVVSVAIEAKNQSVPLKGAIERFYANEGAVSEIKRISAENLKLQLLLDEKSKLAAELADANNLYASSGSATDLAQIRVVKGQIKANGISIVGQVKLYEKVVEDFYVKKLVHVKDDVLKSLTVQQNKALSQEAQYLDVLRSVISRFSTSFEASVEDDLVRDIARVDFHVTWSLPDDSVLMPFNMGKTVDSFTYEDESLHNGSKIYFEPLGRDANSMLSMKYAIYYVMQANDVKIEIPVLVPVQSQSVISRSEQCASAKVVGKPHTGNYYYSCFNYQFEPKAIRYSGTIDSFKHRRTKSLMLQVSNDVDIEVSGRFEIREMKSGGAIFEKKFL